MRIYNLAYYIYIGAGRVVFGMIYVYTYRVFCTIIKGIIEIQCSFMDVLCACVVSDVIWRYLATMKQGIASVED